MSSNIPSNGDGSWINFLTTVEAKKLPHAFLINAEAEDSGEAVGKAITERLLCTSSFKPCQNCKSCKLRLASNHPDLKILDRGDDRQIKVEKVRDVIDWATKSSVLGGIKLCLICAADDLNVQAQNALLKVLEEPPKGTFFCLVSNRPSSLLPTVRSRCQTYKLKLPFDNTESFTNLEKREVDASVAQIEKQVPSSSKKGGEVLDNFEAESEKVRDLICAIIDGSISPFLGAEEIDRLSKSESLSVLYKVIFDAMVIQKVSLKEIKYPSLFKASELLSLNATFDELADMVSLVHQGISMSRGFSNINHPKLTERICNYISNL